MDAKDLSIPVKNSVYKDAVYVRFFFDGDTNREIGRISVNALTENPRISINETVSISGISAFTIAYDFIGNDGQRAGTAYWICSNESTSVFSKNNGRLIAIRLSALAGLDGPKDSPVRFELGNSSCRYEEIAVEDTAAVVKNLEEIANRKFNLHFVTESELKKILNAQSTLLDAALNGKLGFTAKTGVAYLEKTATAGDPYAQDNLNKAARDGKLGFTAETGLAYLEKTATAGDLKAQYNLNEAARDGKLGFTAETGLAYLEKTATAGDPYAQYMLNIAARDSRLGFTAETGLAYLEKRADHDEYASSILKYLKKK